MGSSVSKSDIKELKEEIYIGMDYISHRKKNNVEYVYFLEYLNKLLNILDKNGKKKGIRKVKERIYESNNLYMSKAYKNKYYSNNFLDINEKLLQKIDTINYKKL